MTDVKVFDNGARVQYTAAGGQTLFTYPFLIFEKEDLQVFLTPVGQIPNPQTDKIFVDTDYTVTGVGLQDGGDVVLVVPATAGDIITIERDIAASQLIDLTTGGDFKATTINFVHDKATLLIQQNKMLIEDRMLLYQVTDQLTAGDLVLPKLPANTGVGIPIWTKNNAGNLVAGVCDETTTCSTLRSELASQTEVAPGTDDVGYFDKKTDSGKLLTTFLNEINSDITEGNKYNYIINGGFEISQRGLSFNFVGATGGVTLDRWRYEQDGGTTAVERSVTTLPFSSTNNLMNINRTVAGGTFSDSFQRIENLRQFSNQKMFWTFKTSLISGINITIEPTIQLNFGTGGSPSASIFINFPTVILSGQQTHQLEFDVPNLAIETFGTNLDDVIIPEFVFDPSQTFNIDFANAALYRGSRPSPFIPRLRQQELDLCERYYQKSYELDVAPGTNTQNGLETLGATPSTLVAPITMEKSVRLAPRMRIPPTPQTFTVAGVAGSVNIGGGTVVPVLDKISGKSFSVTGVDGSGDGTRFMQFHWTAEAEL